MGCDIHGYLEIKPDSLNKWISIEEIPDCRNYDIFAILADVRNYVNAIPISKSKGIPDDISEKCLRKYLKERRDSHSSSWLDYSEIKNYSLEQIFNDTRISRIDKNTGEILGKAAYFGDIYENQDNFEHKQIPITVKQIFKESFIWNSFFDKMKVLSEIYQNKNVRIVFWFDN